MQIMRILMIGATSTVAQAVALRFAGKGVKIFCLARSEEKMSAVATQLGESCVGSYCFDFNDSNKVQEAVDQAVKVLGSIDLAFIAHGTLPDQIKTEENFTLVEEAFRDNCLSVISLMQPVCKQLEQQGAGKIAVITSVAGDRGRPRNFTYGAAKGALSLYLQGMRSVLWQSGIEVYDFKMGPVDTPMTTTHEKNFSFSTVDVVAKKMEKALTRKRYVVYVPGFWCWVMLAVKNMPEAIFQKLKFLSAR